jgi:type II secretory pathway component PulM
MLVGWGGVAVVLIGIVGWLLPLQQHTAETRERVERKRGDLAFVQMAAPEILAAGPIAAAGATNEPLVVLVDRIARESGLGSAITSSEPSGDAQLRLRLASASFDNVVAWLARLGQQHGIRVVSASIDAASAPGLVNASIELRSAP